MEKNIKNRISFFEKVGYALGDGAANIAMLGVVTMLFYPLNQKKWTRLRLHLIREEIKKYLMVNSLLQKVFSAILN